MSRNIHWKNRLNHPFSPFVKRGKSLSSLWYLFPAESR